MPRRLMTDPDEPADRSSLATMSLAGARPGSPLAEGDTVSGARWVGLFDSLRDAIVAHRLSPGRKLPEDELASIYEVSRAVVRAALQALAMEGLVRLEPNRGAFVAQPTPREAREVFEARAIVEPKVAALAADCAREADIARLREHLTAEHQAIAAQRDSEAIALSARFHVTIAEIAGHSVLTGIVRELVSRSSLIIALYWHRRDTTCERHAHDALVAALARADARESAELMTSHLVDLQSGLRLDVRELAPTPLAGLLRR